MSTRRLHSKQPESFAFTDENLQWAKRQIAQYPPNRAASAIIALLTRAQKQNNGWLPEPAIRYVADMLDMPHIRALEVASFYSMFNLAPTGKYFVQLCGTTPCWLRGADELKQVCREQIGAANTMSNDGQFSWSEVECLGACVNAPMIQINDDYYEDLTPATFKAILDDLRQGKKITPGPQNGRIASEPYDETTGTPC